MAVITFADRYEVVRYLDGDLSKRVVVLSTGNRARAHRVDNDPHTTQKAREIWNLAQHEEAAAIADKVHAARGLGVHIDLKVCPFCGSIPEAKRWHGGGPRKTLVECVNEGCEVAPSVTGSTPQKAAHFWNSRYTPLVGDEQIRVEVEKGSKS